MQLFQNNNTCETTNNYLITQNTKTCQKKVSKHVWFSLFQGLELVILETKI